MENKRLLASRHQFLVVFETTDLVVFHVVDELQRDVFLAANSLHLRKAKHSEILRHRLPVWAVLQSRAPSCFFSSHGHEWLVLLSPRKKRITRGKSCV